MVTWTRAGSKQGFTTGNPAPSPQPPAQPGLSPLHLQKHSRQTRGHFLNLKSAISSVTTPSGSRRLESKDVNAASSTEATLCPLLMRTWGGLEQGRSHSWRDEGCQNPAVWNPCWCLPGAGRLGLHLRSCDNNDSVCCVPGQVHTQRMD